MCTLFKIISRIIGWVLILMIDKRQVLRIRNESLCYQPVNIIFFVPYIHLLVSVL